MTQSVGNVVGRGPMITFCTVPTIRVLIKDVPEGHRDECLVTFGDDRGVLIPICKGDVVSVGHCVYVLGYLFPC
jgi:hypothetical protein